ncbi:MAG: metal ABC transporter permease [Thaumarchaeota archaeon]|nr:metal ABC transporter permease [Nitrososphaerota archaeon]
MVLDILAYDFMQRALLAAIIVAITAPVVGVFMVLRRLSLMGETLSHITFAGVSLGVFLNIFPLWSALVATVLGSMGIAKIRQSARLSGDAALAVFFALGLGGGIVLLSLSRNVAVSLSSILFGSVLLVGWEDIFVISGTSIFTLGTVFLFYKEMFYVTLDEDLAKVSGLPVNWFNYLLSILAAIMIVAAMRVVGILMVSAMSVIPTLASMQLSRSFRQTIFLAMFLAVISVFLGMFIAFYAAVPPGGTIVLTTVSIFFLTVAAKTMRRKPNVKTS